MDQRFRPSSEKVYVVRNPHLQWVIHGWVILAEMGDTDSIEEIELIASWKEDGDE